MHRPKNMDLSDDDDDGNDGGQHILTERSMKAETARKSTAGPIFAITIIFLGGLFALYSVYRNFPALDEDEKCHLKLPRDIEDAKRLGLVLQKYKSTNFYEVTTLFFLTYIFLQTFAIPGSVFLSILSGYLYPLWFALSVVCLCSAVGATGCYMISYFVGKPLVLKYLPNRTQSWQVMVERQRDNLFNYLLFLRITPFLPNWFINIVSPVLKIPVYTFFFATFFGVAPLSFIAIQAGTTLHLMVATGELYTIESLMMVVMLAMLPVLPVILKQTAEQAASNNQWNIRHYDMGAFGG